LSEQLSTLLGIRTDFSLGESVIASEKVAEIAKRLGQKHVAVADTMNVSALIDVAKKAEKEGIEAHIGVRLRIVDDPLLKGAEGKALNRTAYYVKAWPKDDAGLRQIFEVLTLSQQADHFHYLPRLGLEETLAILRPSNVLITTGDSQGVFTHPEFGKIFDRLLTWGDTDVVVELVALPTPYFERVNLNAERVISGDLQQDFMAVRTMVTTPTLFDDGAYNGFFLNMALQGRGDLRKPFTYSDPYFKDFNPKTQSQFVNLVAETIKGMNAASPDLTAGRREQWKRSMTAGTSDFLRDTAYRWKKAPLALPKLAIDPGHAVMEACKLGAKDRLFKPVFGYQPTQADISSKYLPRLKYEMDVLKRLEFCDYFLVVADLVNWAKGAGIMVGPGRGSVGGSLVAFLMGITDIDPIRFDLLFERFINPSRNDLPDADLDFMSSRREEIIRYLEKKYGTDHVAGINNYGVLGSKSAIKDVARVFGMNVMDIQATKYVPSVHGQPVDLETAHKEVGEIQKFATENPKIWQGALDMQGVMRSYGRHAAGTIVSGVPIKERAAIEKSDNGPKVNWDMRVCEDQGLVKLDVLGLSTLDTLSRCVRYIRERHSKTIDLISIPLDDEKTLQAFSNGETIGVFQFEGGAARRILKDMASSSMLTFNDLVAANALNRPGPIDAGLVQNYVDARNGHATIPLAHPNMSGALSETYNVIVYQEQVMRVAVDLCGFDLSEADKLRKAMGKKDPVMMATFRKAFVDGAATHSGMAARPAEELFDQIEVFAGYAFNKSHAAEYSLISYQAMWCKVHYPVEFYAAALSTVGENKLQVLVTDAKLRGISVMPPDMNISTNEFTIVHDTALCIPFNRVQGVSDRTGNAILKARQNGLFSSFDDFRTRVAPKDCNVRQVEHLDKVGAFFRLCSGQPAPDDESRRKDQMELMPGLVTGVVVADRVLPTDGVTLAQLKQIMADIKAVDPNQKCAFPALLGKTPRFMCIVDGAGTEEEEKGRFAVGRPFQYIAQALSVCGIDRKDGYWTGLIKRKKAGRSISANEIKTYQPFLEREIELFKPPLIVCLGSASARYMVPDLKGDIMEHAGRVFWNKKLQALVLIGFNPQTIYFDDAKFDVLCEVFDIVKAVVDPS
jgi:DNA polymerase-3 subunit alpha